MEETQKSKYKGSKEKQFKKAKPVDYDIVMEVVSQPSSQIIKVRFIIFFQL